MVTQEQKIDRRHFGRRLLICHACVKVGRKQPQACIVRNISKRGAFLEFDDAPPKASCFQLIIDAHDFEANCEVKHRRDNFVGVYFAEDAVLVTPAPRSGASGRELVARVRAANGA